MLKEVFLILFLVFLVKCAKPPVPCAPPMTNLCEAGKAIEKITSISKEGARDESPSSNFLKFFHSSKRTEITRGIMELRDELQKSDLETKSKWNSMKMIMEKLPYETKREDLKDNIEVFINKIDEVFEEFLHVVSDECRNLPEFHRKFHVTLHTDLQNIRNRIAPPNTSSKEGLFPALTNSLTDQRTPCIPNLSLKSTAITLYRLMMHAEIKLNLLSKFVSFTQFWNEDLPKKFEDFDVAAKNHTLVYFRELKHALEAIQHLPHRSCDPNNNAWIRGESYYELDGFLSPTIFQYHRTCGDWFDTDYSCNKILEADYDCSVHWLEPLKCSAKTTGCSYLEDISVCVTKETHDIAWLVSSNYLELSDKGQQCPAATSQYIKVGGSGEREHACHCKCPKKEWKFYNGLLTSRTSLNFVIVGARFKLNSDGVLFLQPAEGQLGRNGEILGNYSWVPLPKGTIAVSTIAARSYNAIFLDEVQLDDGYVMTGIRLALREEDDGSNKIKGFGIFIKGQSYDYRTGILDLSNPKNAAAKPRGFSMGGLPYKKVNPLHTRQSEPNVPAPSSYAYVKFDQSDVTSDYGKSVLPLLDATPVLELLPLRGIAIYHKGTQDHSGFISLSLHHIDYLKLVDKFIGKYEKDGRKLWSDGILKNNYFV